MKDQLKTNFPIILPKELPITKGTFLTATTKVEANQVEVLFLKVKSICHSMIESLKIHRMLQLLQD